MSFTKPLFNGNGKFDNVDWGIIFWNDFENKMTQDNLLTYPFVRKEEFETIHLENQKLKEQIDVMYAEFNQLKGFLDMGILEINTLIEYSIGKKTKATEDEIIKIEKRLKDISNIDRLSKMTSDNIKYRVEINDRDKIITGLKNDIKTLQIELKRVVDEQTAKEEKDKITIFTLRNLDDTMKQRLKENETQEFRNDELKKLNEALHNDLAKKALKLEYGGHKHMMKSMTSSSTMIAYAPQDYRMINKKLRKVKKLLKAKFMRTRKIEKAKRILFEIKQNIALMPDSKDKQFLQDEIKSFDEVVNA